MRYRKKIICMLLSAILFLDPIMASAESRGLSEEQKRIADEIAKIAIDNWDEYGVLPSVAVVQAFVESSLGVNQSRPNNLWGIKPGGECSAYSSLEAGVMAYLKVINNGRYDKGICKKDFEIQLRSILDGGYYGADDGGTVEWYYSNCISSIEKYGFEKYDKKLMISLKREEEKRRKKKWKKTYTLVHDETIPVHAVMVDRSIIKGGTVKIKKELEVKGIYDVIPGQKGKKIGISDVSMDGMKVRIEVNEGAKG